MNKALAVLTVFTSYALNPMQEWGRIPAQKLTSSAPQTQQIDRPLNQTPHYEDMMTVAVRGVIAAFHVDPKTFLEDHSRLKNYFEEHALTQIEQKLFSGTGTGVLDHCIISQQICDASPINRPVILKKLSHLWEIKLPIILHDSRRFDATVQINLNAYPPKISNFIIEKSK